MSRTATPRDLIPETHSVLGTLLRPFSLGHHLLFDRIGLPFAGDPTAEASPEDLALAVFLCAAPYRATSESMLRGEWEDEFRTWTGKLRPRFYQRTRFIHEAESESFSRYLVDGYRKPPVWRHGTSGITFSSPWECLISCRLVCGGFQMPEVMELYLPAAWYFYHTLSEIGMADNLTDVAKWRPTFYTAEDEALLRAAPSN